MVHKNEYFCVCRVGLFIIKISLVPCLSLAVAFHSIAWVTVFTGYCDYAMLFVSFCMWIDSCVPSEGILIMKNGLFKVSLTVKDLVFSLMLFPCI